jgi:transcriptional regulator with XRE-family HTH domain
MSIGQRAALADFLRTCRSRLTPAEVGLPPGERRRTTGLRREEVAILSGVSVTWYTWLEQGRRINPSPAVLGAIARTLRMSADETAHLLALAEPAAEPPGTTSLSQALRDLIDGHDPAPATLVDARWDVLAWNCGADALWRYSSLSDAERNLAWLSFHPFAQERLVDWSDHARRIVAELRASSATMADDARFREVVDRLRATQAEADAWWSRGDVRMRTGAVKHYNHPTVGRLSFEELILRPLHAPDLHLSVLMPVHGTGTAAHMATLAADWTSAAAERQL